jgi:hypothetical protein
MMDRRLLLTSLLAAFAAACLPGCMMKRMHHPDQGIHGTFLTYGPPRDLVDCSPFKTQFEKDDCRRLNERVIEEPHQALIKIRNLQTGEVSQVQLDAQGSYRASLAPGEYEVCVEGECSDPMTVRMNTFIPYGQRLPRPGVAGKAPADSLKGRTGSVSP